MSCTDRAGTALILTTVLARSTCQPKATHDAALYFFHVLHRNNTLVVNSFPSGIFAVARDKQPVKSNGVNHVCFDPVKFTVVWMRKCRLGLQLHVVALDGAWWRCAHGHDAAKSVAIFHLWRDNHHRPAFCHLWLAKSLKVANKYRALVWMKFNRHSKEFYLWAFGASEGAEAKNRPPPVAPRRLGCASNPTLPAPPTSATRTAS